MLADINTIYLKSRNIPPKLNRSNIIFIHKKGNKEEVRNYRPISLYLIVYNIFTKVTNDRLQTTLDEAQPREQAGFKSRFSTTDHTQTIRGLQS